MNFLFKNTKLSTTSSSLFYFAFSNNYFSSFSFISSQLILKNKLIYSKNGKQYLTTTNNYPIIWNDKTKKQKKIEDLQQQGFPFWQMKFAVENAINENLKNGRFSDAQNVWKLFLDNTQSPFGILSLIEFSFRNCEGDILRRNIVSLWHDSETLLTVSDFIAYLVIGMMKTGYFEEANIFAKKFTIFGTSFIVPFKEAIEEEKDCLQFFEQFSQFLENIFFSVPALTKELKAKRKAKRDEKLSNKNVENLEEKEENNFKDEENIQKEKKPPFRFQNLIWIWAPPRKFKNSLNDEDLPPLNRPKKQRIHKVDLKSLEKFCIIFVELWQQKAVKNSDIPSMESCHLFMKRNGLSNLPTQQH